MECLHSEIVTTGTKYFQNEHVDVRKKYATQVSCSRA